MSLPESRNKTGSLSPTKIPWRVENRLSSDSNVMSSPDELHTLVKNISGKK